MNLAQWQQACADWLLSDAADTALLAAVDDPAAARRQGLGLRVYRNNVLYSLCEALRAQFPAVARVVGPAFFGALARDYVRAQPPCEPSLTLYGEGLAAFIERSPHCASLPWLSALARLEWLCQRALHAADSPALSLVQLQLCDPLLLGQVRLQLADSAALLHSAYPIDQIWTAQFEAEPEMITLTLNTERWLLILRVGEQAQVITLDPAVFELLRRLQEGATLEAAWSATATLLQRGDAELPTILAYLLTLGVFTAFDFSTELIES
ncbi:MAG: DNA-binding domain-containing protein [Pseudomonadales bacterium]|jgi:hypothetical protein|nr:DNA-binding domain-containing protein [Pseudomonadales bacterium]